MQARWIPMMMALMLIATLCACGGSDGDEQAAATPTDTLPTGTVSQETPSTPATSEPISTTTTEVTETTEPDQDGTPPSKPTPTSDTTPTQAAEEAIDSSKFKWRYQIDSRNLYGPVIGADDTIYVRGDKDLYAISSDGSLKWIKEDVGNVLPACGPDGTIYLCSQSVSPEGRSSWGIDAFNPDGSLKLRYENPDFPRVTHPAIGADGTVYSLNGFSLIALNPDGSLQWEHEGHGASYAENYVNSPVVGPDGTIYYVMGHTCFAVNPDGSLKWEYALNEGPLGGSCVPMYIVIGPDGTLYMTLRADSMTELKGHVYVLNPDGSLKWSREVEDCSSEEDDCVYSPGEVAIADDGTVYVSVNSSIYWEAGYTDAFNPDGTLKMRFLKTLGRLVIIDADSSIFAGHGVILNPDDGSVKWGCFADEVVMGDGYVKQYGLASIVVGSDGTIYGIGGYGGGYEEGFVAAFEY
ncbi:MAG: PQQ-like beta-propeller repeat protein [Planctomycetes bacterium]|nr:PQQ-like beta-propeller repeat protein [Planctomycetota bacterium]